MTRHVDNNVTSWLLQTDLVDHFAQLADLIVKLKRVKVTTPRAATVHHNFVLAKCQYYHEHAFTFRKLQRRLETMTSPEVLSSIQRFVDHNVRHCCANRFDFID